jgi:hypothetical protein
VIHTHYPLGDQIEIMDQEAIDLGGDWPVVSRIS